MTTYRPATPADEAFIVSGWSTSYRLSKDLAFLQMAAYAEVMHAVIRGVLSRPRVQVIVAQGEELLKGFLCYELSTVGRCPLVIYTYVAQPYRRMGHVRGMFHAAGIDPDARFEYAATTKASHMILRAGRKAPLAAHNPHRARFAEEK